MNLARQVKLEKTMIGQYIDNFQGWNEDNLGVLRWANPLYTVIAAGEAVVDLFDGEDDVAAPLPSPSSASSEWPSGYGGYDGAAGAARAQAASEADEILGSGPAMLGGEWPKGYGEYGD